MISFVLYFMAIIQSLFKNSRSILKVSNYEMCCIGLKSLSRDLGIHSIQRGAYYKKLFRYGQSVSFTSIRNRCLFTGRARSVIKRVHLGRHVYKKLASGGSIAGVIKATW